MNNSTDRAGSLHETRTPSMIVGCDPGKSGALARLDHAGRLVDVADMPVVGTRSEMADLLVARMEP